MISTWSVHRSRWLRVVERRSSRGQWHWPGAMPIIPAHVADLAFRPTRASEIDGARCRTGLQVISQSSSPSSTARGDLATNQLCWTARSEASRWGTSAVSYKLLAARRCPRKPVERVNPRAPLDRAFCSGAQRVASMFPATRLTSTIRAYSRVFSSASCPYPTMLTKERVVYLEDLEGPAENKEAAKAVQHDTSENTPTDATASMLQVEKTVVSARKRHPRQPR